MALWKAFGIIQSTVAILNCNMTKPSFCLLTLYTWWQSLEKTPLCCIFSYMYHSCKQFSRILRLLQNSSFQSVSVRLKCWDSLTMNPQRLGEEIIKDNVLHYVFRKLSVDAITAEENFRSHSLKGVGINVNLPTLGLAIHPSRLPMAWEAPFLLTRNVFIQSQCLWSQGVWTTYIG